MIPFIRRRKSRQSKPTLSEVGAAITPWGRALQRGRVSGGRSCLFVGPGDGHSAVFSC